MAPVAKSSINLSQNLNNGLKAKRIDFIVAFIFIHYVDVVTLLEWYIMIWAVFIDSSLLSIKTDCVLWIAIQLYYEKKSWILWHHFDRIVHRCDLLASRLLFAGCFVCIRQLCSRFKTSYMCCNLAGLVGSREHW